MLPGHIILRTWRLFALVLLLMISWVSQSAAQTAGTTPAASRSITLAPGDSLVIDTPFEIADIIVGAETVATAVPISRTSFVVQTHAAGRTAIIVLDADRVQRQHLDVFVRDDFSNLAGIVNGLDSGNRIEVTNVNGRVLLRGRVRGEAQRQKAIEVAESYGPAPVIDSLRVVDPRQVMLRVNILELSRSSGKDLGISLFGSDGSFLTTNGTPAGSSTGTIQVSSALLGDFNVDYVLQALEVKGLARRLANPTLVTVNGQEANFVVGGEVPILSAVSGPDAAPTGQSQTDYREYGVKLNFTPFIMEDDNIRLVITPEVSEVDWTRRVDENPAFVTRRVTTTVELRSGSSFVIAGLLQSNSTRAIAQYPWLGNIPVLGALFRSSSFQNDETEMVVVVTPVLVNSKSPQLMPYDPRSRSQQPSEAEFFLLGLVESSTALTERFRAGVGANGPFGHILPGE